MSAVVEVVPTHLCISDPAVLMPRHKRRMTPVRATPSRNLVLVTKLQTALEGGSWALAAFQLKPPLGRSIVATSWGGPQHHPCMCSCGRSSEAGGGLRWTGSGCRSVEIIVARGVDGKPVGARGAWRQVTGRGRVSRATAEDDTERGRIVLLCCGVPRGALVSNLLERDGDGGINVT